MIRRLILTAFLFAFLATGAVAQFGLPRIPVPLPGRGQPQPWFATGLADAVTDVPFLDAYEPGCFTPVAEMPPGPQGGYLLGPGAYSLWSQSY